MQGVGMKRASISKRRDRLSGKGSPYAKGHKAPYRYSFPTGKEYMEMIGRTGKHWACLRRENGENSLCLQFS